MSKSSFNSAIGNYRAVLARVVRNAFNDYFEIYSAQAADHSKCTRASLIHDLMIKHAKKLLPEKVFRYIVIGDREVFNFCSEFLIQFKKLKRSMLGSNYPTHQALMFSEDGEIDVGLPGIGGSLPLITIGYVPRQYFSGIEGIFATQTVEHRPQWVERLSEEEERQLPISSILKPNDTESKIQKSRIKRKDRKQQQSDTDTGLSRG